MTRTADDLQCQITLAEQIMPAAPPRFLSWAFHFIFFPKFLAGRARAVWRRLRSRPEPRTGFGPPIEFTIVPVACVAVIGFAMPSIIGRRSIGGMIAAGLAAACIAGLAGWNLYATRGERASFENFHVPTFALLLALGLAWGGYRGGVAWAVLWGAVGYVAGIAAGLYEQKLGTLAFLARWAADVGLALVVAWAGVYFFVSFLI